MLKFLYYISTILRSHHLFGLTFLLYLLVEKVCSHVGFQQGKTCEVSNNDKEKRNDIVKEFRLSDDKVY